MILEIKEGERVRTLGGYALWRISAEVVRSFKGEFLPGEEIRYHRTTETEFPPPEKGSRHIVSFVLEEGNLVIPDEGYHFPWSPTLRRKWDALLFPPPVEASTWMVSFGVSAKNQGVKKEYNNNT